MSAQRPERWLLIDVDATLVPDILEPGVEYIFPAGPGLPVRADAARALRATGLLSPDIRLGWYTGREEEAAQLFGVVTAMDRAPFVPIPKNWYDDPAHTKLEGLRQWLSRRPAGTRVVVLDDDVPTTTLPHVTFVPVPVAGLSAALVRQGLALLGPGSKEPG